LLVDAGTNVDCRPQHLFEFAVMGSIYAKRIIKYENPGVGLLSVGEEETKGNEISKETFKLLKNSSLNFLGNVEGRDILKGTAQVVVCDGFVGNILLKFGESVPSFLKAKLMAYAENNVLRKGLLGLVRGALKTALKDMDYEEHGGVPVLGVNGVTIIGHGKSTPKAIKNMILKATEVAKAKINQHIEQTLAQTTTHQVHTENTVTVAHP
jgi:glycerol-3-phosphate acyltransferase PlsX